MIGGIQAGRIDELSARVGLPRAARGGARGRFAHAGASPGRADESGTPGTDRRRRANVLHANERRRLVTRRACRTLEERGVVLRRRVAVTALRRTPAGTYPWEVDTLHTTTPANAVVMAVPAPTVGALLGSHDPALDDLRAITSAGAAMVTFSIARDAVALPSSGPACWCRSARRGPGQVR